MQEGSDNQNGYDSDQGRTQRAPSIPGATGRPAGDTNDQTTEEGATERRGARFNTVGPTRVIAHARLL